jgi:hypothetical protein
MENVSKRIKYDKEINKEINKEIKKDKKYKYSNTVIEHHTITSPKIMKEFIDNGFSDGIKKISIDILYELAIINKFIIIIDEQKSCINWIGTRQNMNSHYHNFKQKWLYMFKSSQERKWKHIVSSDFITIFNESGFFIHNKTDINYWNKVSINDFCKNLDVQCTIDIITKYIILEGCSKGVPICSELIRNLINSLTN